MNYRLRDGKYRRKPEGSNMELIVWAGAAVSLIGLVGLVWCILRVWRARRAQLDDVAMRIVLQKVLPINTGALFLSVLGLMMVVIGILLR